MNTLTNLLGKPLRNKRDGTTGTAEDTVTIGSQTVTVYRTERGNVLTVDQVDAEEVKGQRES